MSTLLLRPGYPVNQSIQKRLFKIVNKNLKDFVVKELGQKIPVYKLVFELAFDQINPHQPCINTCPDDGRNDGNSENKDWVNIRFQKQFRRMHNNNKSRVGNCNHKMQALRLSFVAPTPSFSPMSIYVSIQSISCEFNQILSAHFWDLSLSKLHPLLVTSGIAKQ